MAKDKKRSRKKTVEDMPAVVEPRRTTSSPVYPAVSSESQKALEPIQVDPPAPTPPPPEKTHRRGKEVASWTLKVVLVALPAALSGFFSYLTSKSDQEGSYEVTVTAVKELQEATKELVKQQAYMQGQLDALRRTSSKTASRPAPPSDLKGKVTLSNMPSSYGSAMKSKGRPMEQQSVDFAPPEELFSPEEKTILNDTEKKRALALEELQRKRDAKRAAEDKTPAPAAPH